MAFDKELVDALIEEIDQLKVDLKRICDEALACDFKKLELFEEFGQIADRIFGTAMTMEFDKLGEYSKVIKDTCYMCGQSKLKKAHKKTHGIMLEYIESLSLLQDAIHNKDELDKVQYKLNVAKGKAMVLKRSAFFDLERKSCKY